MRVRPLALATTVALGLTPMSAAPAAADPADPASSRLLLTVAESTRTAQDTPTGRDTVLSCHPRPGGTHPHAEEACAALTAADGDPAALAPGDGPCTMQYAPLTLSATGRWLDRSVDYAEEFPNPCVAGRTTGTVFAF